MCGKCLCAVTGSQIGRSHPGRGRESLTKLQKAMAEAQRLAVQVELNTKTHSPIAPLAAATAPASAAAATNVLQMLRATSHPEDLNNPQEEESRLSILLPTNYTRRAKALPTSSAARSEESHSDAPEVTNQKQPSSDRYIDGWDTQGGYKFVIDQDESPENQNAEIVESPEHIDNVQIDPGEADIDQRETGIDPKESDVDPKEADVDPKEANVELKEADVDPRKADVEVDVDLREADIDPRETNINRYIDTRDEIRIDITEADEEAIGISQPEKPSTVAGLIGIFKQKSESAKKELPTKALAPPPPKLQITTSPTKPYYSPYYGAASPKQSPHPSPIRRSPSPRTGWF